MDQDRPLLTSAATTLEELTARLTAVADRYRETDRDDITADLDEVERALRAATRRLNRLVRRID